MSEDRRPTGISAPCGADDLGAGSGMTTDMSPGASPCMRPDMSPGMPPDVNFGTCRGGLRILAAAKALPHKKVTNDDLSRRMDTSDEWIRTRSGILSRYYCEEETCTDLAVAAARKLLDQSGIDPSQIGAVVAATSTADHAFPSTAAMVQRELGLSEDLIAFDLSAACSGFLMGLEAGWGLFRFMTRPYLLLIGAEKLSRVLDPSDRTTAVLFGDGAGAVLLARSPGRFLAGSWCRGDLDVLKLPQGRGEKAYISMKGREVYRFAVTVIPDAIDQVLEEAGLSMDDVDLVVCHQANERIIRSVQKKYPGHEDKFFVDIAEYGNTSAASIPLALADLWQEGRLQQSRRVLLVGFGAGLTWSCALMEEENS